MSKDAAVRSWYILRAERVFGREGGFDVGRNRFDQQLADGYAKCGQRDILVPTTSNGERWDYP